MSASDNRAIAEIDRRLNREGLTALDRAGLIARRREIWQRLHRASETSNPSGPEPGDTA